jgi:GTP-binding protein
MIPKIVIVGRPNVGKSSLLNLLARRRVSIVDPTAGVTRDRISTTAEIPPEERGGTAHFAEVIDTGGYGVKDEQNLTAQIERQIACGLAEADVVLFVIDAQEGIVLLDEMVAKLLREHGSHKPVVLVANKVDADNLETGAYEAMKLGFGEPVMISATTSYNKNDLYTRLRQVIDFDAVAARGENKLPDEGVRLAIVGKRNAGKSTLVNALAGEERVIVSELEGTTRDSVDVRFELDGHVFTAIDTAGVRKRKSVKGDIEYYSLHRSLRSVRRADVCLLMIDAAVPVSQVDRQLVNEILKHYRPTIVVVNKWDLAEKEYTQEQYVEYLDEVLMGLRYAPIVFISAKEEQGMRQLLGLALNLFEQAQHRVGTAELNKVIEQIMAEKQPSSRSGKQAKIYYATQLAICPPTIALFVNDPEMFEGGYQRFLLNRLRDHLPYSEVPIELQIKGKPRPHREGHGQPSQAESR